MIFSRRITKLVGEALDRQAAVALIGPRQVGKTTLAHEVAGQVDSEDEAPKGKHLYLDLEARADRAKLADPALFLADYAERLVVLDGIHRYLEIFQALRGLIDRGRRRGRRTGRFLILGSASMDLIRQSGETLAGRIEYVELQPFDITEVATDTPAMNRLWSRGGFPGSFLTRSDHDSLVFRQNFIRTYLERDVPQFGGRISTDAMERLWIMLAHSQGGLLNVSRLAAGLSVSAPTVSAYIDLLSALLLVRRLRPWHVNTGKRVMKSPKVYVRDSGITHALLGIKNHNDLCGHPVVGTSWEGFVIENLLALAPPHSKAGFYRTAAGAEIDLVLAMPGQGVWALEIKRSLATNVSRGFHNACADLNPRRAFIVHAGEGDHPLSKTIRAIGLREMMALLRGL